MGDSTDRNTKYLTLEDIARELDVSERTVIRWVRAGELRAFKLRNVTRIAKEDFSKFLEEHMKIGGDK